tara:strand:- start:4090 stop:4776 length:687 start_codon:yes stop_codon:yes gene_type:complete
VAYELTDTCVSCNKKIAEDAHTETYRGVAGKTFFPLCRHCLEFPHRIEITTTFENVRLLELISDQEFLLLQAIAKNKADRYQNPKPVIIGLVLTDLWGDGGVLLAGKRSPQMKEYPNELALLSGYMEEKHGGWRGSLAAEGEEELCIEIDAQDKKRVLPGSFDDAGKGRLMLNYATVMPGVTMINEFVPNEETVARHEIEFSRDNLPEFGIPQHNKLLHTFCSERLGW